MSEKTLEILATISLQDKHIKRIRNVDPSIHLSSYTGKEADSIPAELWDKAEVLFTSGRNLPKPEQVPNLKWAQNSLAGVETLLRSDLAHKPGLLMTSASGTMVGTMGEFTLMAMLMLAHKMPEIMQLQRKKEWGNNLSKSLQPQDLRGLTVGIVGYGSIGREVARVLQPFGVKILAAKKNVMKLEDEGYTPAGLGDPEGKLFTRLYPIEALKGMLTECDHVVIALPHTPETHHLFDKAMFDAMKPGAFLINVARGGMIKDEDLVAALKTGKVAGAVLDVFDPEPLPADSPYWNLPNVIVTPHVSGVTPDLMDDVVELFAVNLKRYLEGQTLYNLVDLDKGY
ncbi:MAG TPA: D-2-hydroxyacid dehydrogenase [Anaerolineaceae bacterium]|nr:D-2-hydroxyacid dehydrogenase [Anaerolineaceae bacterium]